MTDLTKKVYELQARDTNGLKEDVEFAQFVAMTGFIAGKIAGENVSNKIAAIKFVHSCTNVNLTEAKAFVDLVLQQVPIVTPTEQAKQTPTEYVQNFLYNLSMNSRVAQAYIKNTRNAELFAQRYSRSDHNY